MVVLLGFQDEEIEEKTSWDTNKIGGSPDWMSTIDASNLPNCGYCNELFKHILQIYCPLIGSEFHRTLNVFLCFNSSCSQMNGNSLLILRSQQKEEKQKSTEPVKIVSNDDWGTNDWIDNAIANITEDQLMSSSKENNVDESENKLVESFASKVSISSSTPSYHIYVCAENDVISDISTEYEMNLYRAYLEKEGGCIPIEDKSQSSHKEKYEKTVKKHGDHNFHNFKKVVSKAAEQILRYEWNGQPLLYSSLSQPSKNLKEIPNCHYCNSPRLFELQLMPHLVSVLSNVIKNNSSHQNNEHLNDERNIQFACAYIFTCSNACWDTGLQKPRVEYVVLHNDPDDNALFEKSFQQ